MLPKRRNILSSWRRLLPNSMKQMDNQIIMIKIIMIKISMPSSIHLTKRSKCKRNKYKLDFWYYIRTTEIYAWKQVLSIIWFYEEVINFAYLLFPPLYLLTTKKLVTNIYYITILYYQLNQKFKQTPIQIKFSKTLIIIHLKLYKSKF